MAHVEKLPSGSYRVRIFIGEEDGKKKFKSFTDKDKRRAEFKANAYLAEHPIGILNTHSLLHAIKEYVSSRAPVLSPYTVRGYEVITRSLENYPYAAEPLNDIDAAGLQDLINAYAKDHSAKTTRNMFGLITATLKRENVPIGYVRLPEKEQRNMHIPTDDEVQELVRLSRDNPLEIPILLAAFGPMREGEICAASLDDLSGDILHVHSALAAGSDGVLKKKSPKTAAGDRYIPLPHTVAERIREIGMITDLKPKQISDRFRNFAKKYGFNFRFHDLRHYCASRLHTIMPDAYIMQRSGWATDHALKNVYRHALDDQAKKYNDRANDIFNNLV